MLTGLLVTSMSTACATSQSRLQNLPRPTIAHAELQRMEAFSAYEVVERLMPELLYRRAYGYAQPPLGALPQVYVGENWVGDISYLHDVSATQVIEIRYLRPSEALMRHGREAPRGALELDLRP